MAIQLAQPGERFLWFALATALAVRVAAALLLPAVKPPPYSGAYYFPDSELYWKLGCQLAEGKPYTDGARWVVRSPGYPSFLAVWIRLFGPNHAVARVADSLVGVAACAVLVLLWRSVLGDRVATVGAWLVALYLPAVLLGVVLLSEGLFAFWVSVQLLACWRCWLAGAAWGVGGGERREGVLAGWAALVGLAGALAALTRPSWLPVTPIMALLLVAAMRRAQQRPPLSAQAGFSAGVVLLTFALAMLPWWVRNRLVTGHWVWGTLWVGASLYDGLNPRATGASNMEFLERPTEYGLDPSLEAMEEWEQDRYLREAALGFLRCNPWRALKLAVAKQQRFWSLVPAAEGWNHGWYVAGGVVLWGTIYVLLLWGMLLCRRRPGVLLLLVGPLLYTALLHTVFVGSIRYREPVLLPALGLAAYGLWEGLAARGSWAAWLRAARWVRGRGHFPS